MSMRVDPTIASLETKRGRQFSAEELQTIEDWQNGRQLAQVVGFNGWQLALEILEGLVIGEEEAYSSIHPSDKEKVWAQHSVAYAGRNMFEKFLKIVEGRIEAAKETPEILQHKF